MFIKKMTIIMMMITLMKIQALNTLKNLVALNYQINNENYTYTCIS